MHRSRVIRFGLVGVVNTAVYYSCYLVLSRELSYLLAHVLSTLLAMLGSYFLNCFFTFRISPSWRTFVLFPLSNLTNFVITTTGMGIAVGTLHVDKRLAPLPVALLAIPVTYFATHTLLHRPVRPVEVPVSTVHEC